jgi:hypothetical protein
MGMVIRQREVFYCDEAGAHQLRPCFTSSKIVQLEESARRLGKALEVRAATESPERFSVAVV